MKGNLYVIIGVLFLIAMVTPSNAYYFEFADYSPRKVVQLYYDGDEATHLAGVFGSNAAAEALIDFARDYGRSVTRSQIAIAAEISVHALGWIAGERTHSNPMDISLN